MGKKRIVDVEKHVADRMEEKKNLDATQLNRNMRIYIHSFAKFNVTEYLVAVIQT